MFELITGIALVFVTVAVVFYYFSCKNAIDVEQDNAVNPEKGSEDM